MQKEFLLDTNAYYNLLKESREKEKENSSFATQISTITSGKIFISTITKVEIISVLGKYARGKSGGFQTCTRLISPNGNSCNNRWYSEPKASWNRRKIGAWLQLIKETTEGTSHLVTIGILPFDNNTVCCAEHIIPYALVHNFASMDAMIAATAQQYIAAGHDLVVVTSDKGLKACLAKVGIPYWDAFQV